MTVHLAVDIPQAAEACGVTEKAIRAAIKAGKLRAKRQSIDSKGDGCGKYLIRVTALDAWLDTLEDA